jgi:hypothetical protein
MFNNDIDFKEFNNNNNNNNNIVLYHLDKNKILKIKDLFKKYNLQTLQRM